MFLIVIDAGGRGLGCAYAERIKGSVARADDTVVQDGERILINTKFPQEFVVAYFADGFNSRLEIEPCAEY